MTVFNDNSAAWPSDDAGAPRVWLGRLTLAGFRNYRQATLTAGPTPVILTGNNGSGKTNILEAVSMLSPGRGLRGAAFSDMVPLGGDGGWAVSARLLLDDAEVALGTGQQFGAVGSAGRTVKIDGEMVGGSGALGDYLQILWLTPAMDGLFTGAASERRRFLDRMAAAFDGAHRTRLGHFERAMRQRNRLFELGERSARYFEAIENQMGETGTAIAAGRIEALDRLASHIDAGAQTGGGAFPHAVLALEGMLEAGLRERAAIDVEDDYTRHLATSRERDRAAGRTLDGPHRSDLLVRHGPKDMPARLSSTGEQKALLIGLILAHAKAVKEARGGLAPVLLLDEIAAHLDEPRRVSLFEEIERIGAQAWLTGTDADVFAPLRSKACFFTVANGTVTMSGDRHGTAPVRQARMG